MCDALCDLICNLMKTNGLVPELYSTDLKRTLDFYVDVLGFEIVFQREEERFVFLQREDAQLMIEEKGRGRNWITGILEYPFGRGANFQIETKDAENLYSRTKERGIAPFMELEDKEYKREDDVVINRQFIVQDPDGYLLRFFQRISSNSLV